MRWELALGVYGLFFLESLALSLLLTPRTIPLAKGWGFLASTGARHLHQTPKTTLGGLAISGAFLSALALNLFVAWVGRDFWQERLGTLGAYLDNIPSVLPRLAAILLGALILVALGLWDDRKGLGPKFKLAVMVAATLPLVAAGGRIQGFLPWPWLGAVATVLWIVLLTNSFNFLDNMDGLSSGVALVAALAFGLLSLFAGEWFMAALYILLAGALSGFLRYNFHPARLFMGDNGSLFIGYMLGSLSVLSTYYDRGVPHFFPVLTPLLVLALPLFDTTTVLWIRFREGRPLMEGDRCHLSHRMLDLGMSRPQVALFIYGLTAVLALGAVPLQETGPLGALSLLGQTGLLLAVIHRLERLSRRRGKDLDNSGKAP